MVNFLYQKLKKTSYYNSHLFFLFYSKCTEKMQKLKNLLGWTNNFCVN